MSNETTIQTTTARADSPALNGYACLKCKGAGWLWWWELDEYSGPANETGTDDNRYSCDACGSHTESSSATRELKI